MKILVTGATGYIGAHTVAKLAEHGHTIVGTDFNFEQNDISKYVEALIKWDIRKPLSQNLPIDNFDAVIHLGAVTKVGPSVANPRLYYDTNISGTGNLLDRIGDTHFIYCSTGAAFRPEASPYAMSKRAAESMVMNHDKHTICRFYNVGGNAGFHKFDDSYSHLIRKAAAVVNHKFDKLQVFGKDYLTRDGTAIRNYTHILDIVNSLIRIVAAGPTRQVECLGNTSGNSVLEVIDTMKRVSGVNFAVEYQPRREGDIEVSVLPQQSSYFKEQYTLEEQCESALKYEI